MALTRRELVKGGLAGVSLAFLPGSIANAFAAATGGRTLVVVQLVGANDTLNTFIPYTDSLYRAYRPTVAIPDAKILQLDSRMGLHPEMAGLHGLYQEGKFSFVTNVGFASLDRSHFRCEDVWQTADENPGGEPRGWIGRWADLYAPSAFSPVADIGISTGTPRGIAAQRALPTCLVDLATFGVEGDASSPEETTRLASTLRRIYSDTRSDAVVDTIRQTGGLAFSAIDILHTLPPPTTLIDYRVNQQPATPLANALRLAAQMIAGGNGTGVIWVKLAGFDTHRGQVNAPDAGGSASGAHAGLLRDVSTSLTAFQRDIETRGLADRVLVMAWSEFGRRVQENASFGTDHGKAGSVMLLGTAVKGHQWYGDRYDLADLDEGDLRPRIDFRSTYATIIRDWLGGDPSLVLKKSYEQLGFLDAPNVRRRAVRG